MSGRAYPMGYVGTHADHHRRRRRRGHERGHAAASAARARGHHGRRAQRLRLVRQLRPALPRGRRHREALVAAAADARRPSTSASASTCGCTTRPCASTATGTCWSVRDLVSDELVELPYDALVLSTGARAVRPPIPGIERALSLRDVEDTDALVAATVGARTAVVVGGGFIGRRGHREPRAPRPRRDPRRGDRPGHGPARPGDGHPGARPHPRARRRPAARGRRRRHRPG